MNNRIFYYWLDPLRALSAILVLICHARSVMFNTYSNLDASSQNVFTQILYLICSQGGFAVCMFYILSGFLVGGKTIERGIHGNISARKFFLDRLFRICIPLTGALALIAIVNLIIDKDCDWIQLIGQYTGLQGVLFVDYGGVFWTLPYEIWFYVVLFSLLLIFRRSKYIITGVLLFGLALCVICQLLPRYFYILALGIICFNLKDYKIKRAVMRYLWIGVGLLLCIYLSLSIHFVAITFGLENIKWVQPISQIMLFTLIAVVLSQYVMKVPTTRISKAINHYGKSFALFSYTLFLTHYQILKLYMAYFPKYDCVNAESVGALLVVCLICIAMAYIFYLPFEKQTRKIQEYFVKRFNLLKR